MRKPKQNKTTRAVCSPLFLVAFDSNREMSIEEAEYHWNDFDWDELRKRIEDDPTLAYHLIPLTPQSPSSSSLDSQSWNHFHSRHSTGKFFKVPAFHSYHIYTHSSYICLLVKISGMIGVNVIQKLGGNAMVLILFGQACKQAASG